MFSLGCGPKAIVVHIVRKMAVESWVYEAGAEYEALQSKVSTSSDTQNGAGRCRNSCTVPARYT